LPTDREHPWQRIGVIGAGAMGSSLAVIASRIAPTVMVVRNPQRAAQIFHRGVVVEGLLEGESQPLVVRSVSDLPTIGGVGLLFIATKTTAIPAVCEDLKPILGDISESDRPVRLISYQNGIDPGREIIRLLDNDCVLRMVLQYGAVLDDETGVVRIGMHEPPHYIGCINDSLIPDCEALARALTQAEFPTEYEPGIERQVWAKSILNAAMSPVAALVDSAIGETLDSPARTVVEHLLREAIAVAKAEGIDLGSEFFDHAMEVYRHGAAHTPSMVEDIRRGRESEVGQLNRQIVERAHAHGVPVPTHETVDALIEAFDWRVYQSGRTDGASADF